MKNRLEVLETLHDSALSQLLENELNISLLTRKTLIAKPGAEYEKIQATLNQKKQNTVVIKEVLSVIEEFIKKEKEGVENGKKV